MAKYTIFSNIISGSQAQLTGVSSSLFGTSSWSNNSVTASYYGGSVTSASYASSSTSASYSNFASTASYVTTAQTASYVLNSVSSSYSSFSSTASYVLNSVSSSFSTFASTASSADNFNVRSSITASNALIINTITAQTLVVQTITSSVDFVTGSTKFGSSSLSTHQFTGSVTISGSLSTTGPVTIPNLTASAFGTSSWANNAVTASFITTAQTASFVTTAQTASYVLNSVSSSYAGFSSTASFITTAQTASYVLNSVSSSYAGFASTASYNLNSVSSSYAGFSSTASYVTTAQTASYVTTAQTASYVLNAISSSYASNGGVTQIVAGTNINISPTSGIGAVTISSTGTSGGSGTNTTASFTNSSTWTFTHGLNSTYVIVQTLDASGNQIIPQNIQLTNNNTATITFPTAESGIAIASLGGVGTTAATASMVTSVGTYGTATISTNNSQAIVSINGSGTTGGTGYLDFLRLTNSAAGATNPNKTLRLNSTGAIEIINSAYTGNLLTLWEHGDLTLSGSIIMNNRPAFSVYGSTTTTWTTTTNTDGTLNGSQYSASFQQGSGLNLSTGLFTAPIAGLYQVTFIGRNSGYAGGISQLAVLKNNSNANGDVAMIEWAASSTMNHVGGGKLYKLAVGDTLRLKVLAGQIQFDNNDSWSVSYIG